MIARHLEAAGMPTVVMGCARDIVESAAVPRFYWSNFPLGHSAGKPFDDQSQRQTLRGALALFERASTAQTTVESEQTWSEDNAWEADFWSIEHLDEASMRKLQREHERVRAIAADIKTSG